MVSQRELRDPIHGFVERSDLEAQLIDTGVFQRLRGIKQSAMTHLVYPGALHTRFEHSIGVMNVAGKLAVRLINDPENTRIIRLAALLHDIGHGPFSHISEDILDRYYDSGKFQSKEKKKIHERITCGIIRYDKEISKLISQQEREKIIGLLLGNTGESIVRSIISGPLDADKQDYLLRDSYFCGVKYGIFDIDRLIGTLQAWSDRYEKILAASTDGVHAIEQFVLAKYYMTTQVYRHKIRLITDAMIVRALELGIEVDGLDWLKQLYVYDESEEYIKNFLEWDDARLTTSLLYPMNNGGIAAEIFLKLKKRQLFKRVFNKSLREFSDANVRNFLADIMNESEFKKKIEEKIADYLSSDYESKIEAHYVVIKAFTIKSVREESRNNEGPIIIITADSTPKKFEDESTLFRSIDEEENIQFLDVYAPVPVRFDEADKRKKMATFSQGIQEILVTAATRELDQRKKKKEGEAHDK